MVPSIRRLQSLRTSYLAALSGLLLAAAACGTGARPTANAKGKMASVQTTSILGTAQAFAVLAGSTVTNTGLSIINDNVGVNPGSAVTGFPPGLLTGGTIHITDSVTLQAQGDTTAAYLDLAGRPCESGLTGQDLGGKTLKGGVYCFTSEAQLTGTLVLDAENRADALFIFQVASKLTTASGASVRLINGASPCNVFWQIGSSATIGSGTDFVGNILALTSISLGTNASLEGRALARNAAVTLDSNKVTSNICQDTTVAACCDDSSVCGGACVNLHKDANHCGTCGKSCSASEICAGGACEACPASRTQCKAQCADLTSDPFNCGACGNTCAGSQTCVAGVCSDCQGQLCSNRCVETRTDRNNCGACGNACATGQCCHQGSCTVGTVASAVCQHP